MDAHECWTVAMSRSQAWGRCPVPVVWQWVTSDPDTMPNQWLLLPEMRGLTIGDLLEKILEAAASRGILILLDLHVLHVVDGLQGLWYDASTSEETVMRGWEDMLRRAAKYWNVFGIDIKNEPHGEATWGSGDLRTDWNEYVQRLMRRLTTRVPDWRGLFFVEGIEDPNRPFPYPSWWGGE